MLIPLFKLADDSEQAIARYLHLGEIVFAARAGELLGYAQIIETDIPGVFELKSIAVTKAHQRQGVGRKLVRTVVRYCRAQSAKRLRVSTSIAASDAVAFYLGNGFRICGFIRDAFSAKAGYPEIEGQTGLPLNDAVVFELPLDSMPKGTHRTAGCGGNARHDLGTTSGDRSLQIKS